MDKLQKLCGQELILSSLFSGKLCRLLNIFAQLIHLILYTNNSGVAAILNINEPSLIKTESQFSKGKWPYNKEKEAKCLF